jgi:hypothetical protein
MSLIERELASSLEARMSVRESGLTGRRRRLGYSRFQRSPRVAIAKKLQFFVGLVMPPVKLPSARSFTTALPW